MTTTRIIATGVWRNDAARLNSLNHYLPPELQAVVLSQDDEGARAAACAWKIVQPAVDGYTLFIEAGRG